MTKLPAKTPLSTALLHALLALLLQAASKFEGCSTAADSAKSAWISGKLEKMWPELTLSLLDEWIVKYYTPVFGGTNLRDRDCDKDIEVMSWMYLLQGLGRSMGGNIVLLCSKPGRCPN